mmetsp:Transcript_23118/g.38035  ORF Transcript_23118/g.38035 Transcript_23118/m.38035 type:complete len:149 (-) Transcript_23118:14-460(-)|eukprot:CAMPEP_0184335340 /NCGR_PEP_ID=MMETSP1089-20130417/3918_1 /TAXON_ID=38269 ORGANISM="Gloeochaete wittrockiana, Strain SAG46.84" /NCGR_SAMPLE_ID=MMETSP1089 /ASSEMBLY_ACC=CAM_ASM_000445 /LENGTH=148 /DNA_ID=CAMNT_0026659945 /DNA_START=40 /DNA_END=486 /DNA_ORIENTATION=-
MSFIGRILLVLPFLLGGIDHALKFELFAKTILPSVWFFQENPIFQEHPEAIAGLLAAAIALMLLGSVLVIFNVRVGYLFLILFLAPVTAIMHAFWRDLTNEAEQIVFVKNVALLGALITLFCNSGSCSKAVDTKKAAPAASGKKPKKA